MFIELEVLCLLVTLESCRLMIKNSLFWWNCQKKKKVKSKLSKVKSKTSISFWSRNPFGFRYFLTKTSNINVIDKHNKSSGGNSNKIHNEKLSRASQSQCKLIWLSHYRPTKKIIFSHKKMFCFSRNWTLFFFLHNSILTQNFYLEALRTFCSLPKKKRIDHKHNRQLDNCLLN